jgi:hypothetical protein
MAFRYHKFAVWLHSLVNEGSLVVKETDLLFVGFHTKFNGNLPLGLSLILEQSQALCTISFSLITG